MQDVSQLFLLLLFGGFCGKNAGFIICNFLLILGSSSIACDTGTACKVQGMLHSLDP